MAEADRMMQDVYDYLEDRRYGHDRELRARLHRVERAIAGLTSAITVGPNDMLVISLPSSIGLEPKVIEDALDGLGLKDRYILVFGGDLAVVRDAR